MVSLFNLFVNKNNKPKKTTGQSYAVKKKNDQQQRAQQKKNWKTHYPPQKGTSDPVGKAITDNAKKMKKHDKEGTLYSGSSSGSGNSGNGSSGSGNSGGGSSDSSGSGGSNQSGGGSSSSNEGYNKKAYKKALASIRKMKDSNVSFQYKTDYNDLWNQATLQKQDDVWILKEEVFLYTFHDKQRHRYLNSLSIDIDKTEIMGTCQVSFPFDQKLMEYWIPGKTTFAIVGGTFDREVLFVGRVSEVNQVGDQIDMVGQNVGWKFKAYMTKKFEQSLQNMTVKNAVKLIFKQLGFTKGRYHIDLSGIPNINKYKIGEDCSVEKNGEAVQNVPDLTTVVKNLKSYNIDKYIAKKSETRDTQKAADDYDKKSLMTSIDRAIDSNNSYYPSSLRQNYGISTTSEEDLIYTPIIKKLQGTQKLEDYLVRGYSGGSDYTYEDVLNNIASAIDAHFFIVDTTVCFMSFNALLANSSLITKSVTPTIDFWQLQEGSYELDLNQYGYYNTVKVKYKNGTVTKCYDDLVRVFGEISITYKEPKLDYEAAMLKAQAYLSAHIRDFGMELKATILHTGKIIPATFIKLKNPLTMSEGLFFIHGVSVQWSADNQTLISDLDLRFGPENPDNPEIPEAGVSYNKTPSSGSGSVYNGNVSANVKQAAEEMCMGATSTDECAELIYNWFQKNIAYSFYWDSRHGVKKTLQGAASNCYDTSIAAYQLFTEKGIKCQFIHGTLYTSGSSYGHYWLKILYKGKWNIVDLGRKNKAGIGKYNGKLSGGRVEQKNY